MQSVKSLDTTWTSAAQVIHDALKWMGRDEYSMTELPGLRSYAFRMTIHEKDINAAGPTMYAPSHMMKRPLEHLGYDMDKIGSQAPVNERNLADIRHFIIDYFEQGHAVIGWYLGVPEFSLIGDAMKKMENKTIKRFGVAYHATLIYDAQRFASFLLESNKK